MQDLNERAKSAKVVFDNFGLKGKLKNVSTDLTTGLRSLSARAKTLNKKARKALATYEEGSSVKYDQIYDCDFDTGFVLWRRFQASWVAIREDTDKNAGFAEAVDAHINELYKEWKRWEATVSQFHENLVTMPDIIAQVEIAQTQIGAIGDQMLKVEKLLLEHEDVTERLELEKRKCNEKLELSKLVEKRQKAFQETKAKYEMTEEESGEMARVIERQESIEKQQVYEDAFMEQMEKYIRYGELERPIGGSVGHDVETTDISFDESDLDALKEFLGPEELDTVMKSQAVLSASNNSDVAKKKTVAKDETSKILNAATENKGEDAQHARPDGKQASDVAKHASEDAQHARPDGKQASDVAKHASEDAQHARPDGKQESDVAKHASEDAQHARPDAKQASGVAEHASEDSQHGCEDEATMKEKDPMPEKLSLESSESEEDSLAGNDTNESLNQQSSDDSIYLDPDDGDPQE